MTHSSRLRERKLVAWRSFALLLIAAVASLSVAAHADQEREKPEPAKLAASPPMPVRPMDTAVSPAWLSPGVAGARSGSSDVRWIGTAGLALVLAVCGALGFVARRYMPKGSMGSMKVLGRVGLTPKHAVYMVQVGRRVLLVGTGPQGSPSLISELEEDELPLMPSGSAATASARREGG